MSESQSNSHSGSTFKLSVILPREISLPGKKGKVDREAFFEWVWGRFSDEGLLGVHEGTLLCDQAAEQGLETDSWMVDSAEAPRERDWIKHQTETCAELYFATQDDAARAMALLKTIPEMSLSSVEEQKQQDWDAEWKASFLNAGEGVKIPPFWRIIPPWVNSDPAKEKDQISSIQSHERALKINPGAGFGTGTHETTQLCLSAMGEISQEILFDGIQTLDFGSGSGILSVGLALLGANVDAVEVDPLALDNAQENAKLNEVESRIHFSQSLGKPTDRYRIVVANILRPVLIEFAEPLVSRLQEDGYLILSGLIESDVPAVVETYSRLLHVSPNRAEVYQSGEWRAIVFRPGNRVFA